MDKENKRDIEKKPCPFCGSMKTSVETFDDNSEYWAIWCQDCKCTGPIVKTDLEIDSDGVPTSELSNQVFMEWNKRNNGSDNTTKNGSDN